MKTASLVLVCCFVVVVRSQLPAPDSTCFKKIPTPPSQCCKIPKATDNAIADKCLQQNPVLPPIPGSKRTEGICYFECYLKELGVFVNNAIDSNAASKLIDQTLAAKPEWQPIVKSSMDKCLSAVKNNATLAVKPVSALPGKQGCSFIPEAFMDCLEINAFTVRYIRKWLSVGIK
jgi:hypothetical protein